MVSQNTEGETWATADTCAPSPLSAQKGAARGRPERVTPEDPQRLQPLSRSPVCHCSLRLVQVLK